MVELNRLEAEGDLRLNFYSEGEVPGIPAQEHKVSSVQRKVSKQAEDKSIQRHAMENSETCLRPRGHFTIRGTFLGFPAIQ